MTFRLKETIEAEQYDGTAASVERIMDMLGRTTGINNAPEGLTLDGVTIRKSNFIILDSSKKTGWRGEYEANFLSQYVKLD